ncbi:branched-subunit amino acid transport protein [Acinetobacter calcoaceticus]|uniref:Branched-subunit amino acid transport protein n=1 Tax=Acinetobacter calcoaceticus TaxID=471 RepID=A0A4R1XXX1_ACICA|nr:branched-subunit amino acid transport protein [Acinetobacter calcoaceticus]
MSWGLIIAMSALVFFNRYLFLEPRVRIRLPHVMQRMLHYAAPCLLTAICVPVIFFDEQQQLRAMGQNAYLYAASGTAIFYLISKRILVSSIIGFVLFYLLLYLFAHASF